MESHICFAHYGIKNYSGDSRADGHQLAGHCISQPKSLDDPEQFPPRLLVLLVSPAYLDLPRAGNLLNGIHETFAKAGYPNVPLIGCSTAGVFFDRRVHREGALLVCLASRLLDAKVAVGTNAADEPEKAVNELLAKLGPGLRDEEDPAPSHPPTIFTLLPGFAGNRYPAPQLHQLLRSMLPPQTPIFGGVASADDPERIRAGTLFANKEIFRDAIVAASLTAAIPLGIGLQNGLTDTNRLLRVSALSRNRKTIHGFHEGSATEVMDREEKASPVVLLSEVCSRRDPTVDDPIPSKDRATIKLSREVSENCCFRVLIPQPDGIHKAARQAVRQAVGRAENPLACLAFKCIGLLRYRQKIGLDFERELAEIEGDLNLRHQAIPPNCVGAFVDGEAGVDEYGKSVFGNWSTAAMVFGDELSNHVLVHRGFAELAKLAQKPLSVPQESIQRLLRMIHKIGFRGAMISFWMPDQQEEMIVAKDAVGSRFKKIVDITRRSIHSNYMLAIVAREKTPRYIPDSRRPEFNFAPDAVIRSGIISQYIIPLMNREQKVNAILQFDLGDMSYKPELRPHESRTLNAIGDVVISILNRVFSGEESRITLELDKALSDCAGADTVNEGLQRFIELALQAFGLKAGQIRLAREAQQSLGIAAGVGPVYEAMKISRKETMFGDTSPLGQAFRQGEANIVNDAAENRDHLWMCDLHKENRGLYEAFIAVGSYANVPFVSENHERGTISLIADDPWFFTWFHKGALEALSSRLGFLLDTLRRKYSEQFLLRAIPWLTQIQHFDDPGRVLANITERFARAIKAEYASLFLWDEDLELHILRAHYGWNNPEWVNAARYGKSDVWAGSTILAGAPRHIPNLFGFYVGHNYPPDKRGRYNDQIFGRQLSGSFTVEAIGLPLRIGKEPIGVMILYRSIRDGQPSGFLTTDQQLFNAAAASLTGLVKMLQMNNFERWEKEEFHRHQEIYETDAGNTEAMPFEERVCGQTLSSYQAISADFYIVAPVPGGFTRIAGVSTEKDARRPTTRDAADLPAFAKLTQFNKPITWRRKLSEEDMKSPRLAATAGLIERVCIPLLADNQLAGVLDIKWQVNDRQSTPAVYRYSEDHWRLLGEKIGATYRQHQFAREQKRAEEMIVEAERMQRQAEERKRELDEQSGLAVKATGAYVFQSLHRLANAIQKLKSIPVIIELSEDETERTNAIQNLKSSLESAVKTVESVKDIGERVVNPRRDNCSLFELIGPALEETKAETRAKVVMDKHELETVVVQVDLEQTKQVFINLIDNAVKSMEGKERRVLTIHADRSGADEVTISIKDTGKGMSDEDIRAAMRGFVRTQTHKGVGVLISSVLLHAQRGSLHYRRNGEEGIEAIITLKSIQKEVSI